MFRWILIGLITLYWGNLLGQSLFEQAVEGKTQSDSKLSTTKFDMNGSLRGVIYGGANHGEGISQLQSAYAQASLKLTVRQGTAGKGFAEIRLSHGNESGTGLSEYDLREAYLETYLGRLDIKLGHQVVVWGRADGINPTNNITPSNMLVRSPDEDDRREGNFLLRTHYSLRPFRLEAIWVPIHATSVIPLGGVSLPDGVSLEEETAKDSDLNDGTLAMRLNLETSSFEGSLSYFNGYYPLPGLDYRKIGNEFVIRKGAYRMHILGADFSTAAGSYGLRGEAAFRTPHDDYKYREFTPSPDLFYVLGIDRTWGVFNLILQYVGRMVFNFERQEVSDGFAHEPTRYNMMFSSQTERNIHGVSFRPAWSLMYERLDIKLLGMLNFTTDEFYIKPKLTYDITDGLKFTCGGELFLGPEYTTYGFLEKRLSALFVELKTSF